MFFAPAKKVLSVSSRKNPSERFYSAEAYRQGFIISYTHSVNKGRVHDFYRCRTDGTLVLEKTHFVSYGAGIPEPEETPGADFSVNGDCYVISNINRNLPYLVMAVGVIAEHSFSPDSLNGIYGTDYIKIPGEIFLKDYFPPQTSLILKTETVSYIDYFIHKVRSR
ncbi:MAG: DUF1850 domain-containing protein [Treponema sp.]|nr:DUF1850 domain-containing protein [Treponema sp.]